MENFLLFESALDLNAKVVNWTINARIIHALMVYAPMAVTRVWRDVKLKSEVFFDDCSSRLEFERKMSIFSDLQNWFSYDSSNCHRVKL